MAATHIVTENQRSRQPAVALSPEQFKAFERAYLTPPAGATSNEQRNAFANPTVLGIASLTLTLFPLSINWLSWGPNAPSGALVLLPSLYFTSGIGLLLAAVGEFICGNEYPMLSFATLGGFTLSLGAQMDPKFGLAATAVLGPGGTPLTGEAQDAAVVIYQSGLGIWLLTWSAWLFMLTGIASRVNVVFFLAFLMVSTTIGTYGASSYCLASGHTIVAARLVTAAGAFAFVASMFAFWLLLGMLDMSMGGKGLPVGDLSQGFPWRRQRRARSVSSSPELVDMTRGDAKEA